MVNEIPAAPSAGEPERPEDWKATSLGRVAAVRFSSVDKLAYSSEPAIRLCNYLDVYKNDYITGDLNFMRASASQAEIDRFGIRAGDVLITKDSETPDDIGIPAVVDCTLPDLVCGYHLGLIRPNLNEVDPAFLAKQLGHSRLACYFGRQANGLTRYGLPLASVQGTPLWLPALREQSAVGAVLRMVDEAITKNEVVNAKLKQVLAGLVQDLLTLGLDENGQLRDPVAHPEQFYDSPLGQIPSDWDVLPLECLAEVDRGKFGHRPRNDPHFYGGESPFIQTGDVALAGGETIWNASQQLNERGASVSKEFPSGTIAVTIAANIGDTAILGRPMYFPDSVVGVVTRAPNYVRWVELAIRRAKNKLNALAPQSAQRNINLEFLRPLLIPVPRPVEQRQSCILYESLAQQITAEIVGLETLRSIRAGLMSDLLTGRVRVPEFLSSTEAHE